MKRIYLATPHMGGAEEGFVKEAFESNWLSTLGPNIDAFEKEFEEKLGRISLALSSGTSAIHLGLRLLGIGKGDKVVCSDLTFVASANPIRYLGAEPIFVDSEERTWNMDPNLLEEAIKANINQLPKAIVVVHLYGQCADMDPINEIANRYGIPVLEDAAEALGATYQGKAAGTLAPLAAISFNGNKIITTTGGGMLLGEDKDLIEKARFWSTQAREPGIAYRHHELGYNYRMSNVLAGIGRGQLQVLEERVNQKRAIAFKYQEAFADIDGMTLMPEFEKGRSTYWLTAFQIDSKKTKVTRSNLIDVLAKENIEARPVWKPMHMQPLYEENQMIDRGIGKRLFENGICLPSGTNMSEADQAKVIDVIRKRIMS